MKSLLVGMLGAALCYLAHRGIRALLRAIFGSTR